MRKIGPIVLTLLLALLFAVKLASLQGEAAGLAMDWAMDWAMGWARYAKALGYAALPLVFAALIAPLVNLSRWQPGDSWRNGKTFMWLAGFLGCFLLLLAAFQASRQSKQALANDALTILRLDGYIAGIMDVCGKSSPDAGSIILSARLWSERNQPGFDLVKSAMDKDGGISDREKRLIAKLAAAMARSEMSRHADRGAFCRRIENDMNGGTLDLDQNKDTRPALMRIKNMPLQ